MPKPLSQLLYARIQEGDGSPRVITLHDYNQRADAVRAYGLAAAPNGRIIGLESYKGVYIGREIVGFTWFVGPNETPSPLFFGDALAEIERFLWDEIDRQQAQPAELPFLLGVGQGGIMALAAAAAAPDLLSGVIAIDASFPIVPGWSPPLAPLDGLPILFIDRPVDRPIFPNVLTGDVAVERFTNWGGNVSRIVTAAPIPDAEMQAWLTIQPIRRLQGEPQSK